LAGRLDHGRDPARRRAVLLRQGGGRMTFGSLFAGIGGMDLGLERAGMECRWQVEIEPYCQKVLTKHWPNVPKFGDITKVTGGELERVDLIAGGFPCQDISLQGAVWGERAGVSGERSGLWFDYLRIIRVVRPSFVLVENVAAILGNGLDAVLGGLSESGYDAEWDCLPASAFGAPHQRDRMFLVAHHREERRQGRWSQAVSGISRFPRLQDVRSVEDVRGRSDLPEPLVRRSGDGIPGGVDRLAGLGNAVVPPVAEWIGRRILASVERAA
jgi:DNA (cytosine-5)-methyltransferase 1